MKRMMNRLAGLAAAAALLAGCAEKSVSDDSAAPLCQGRLAIEGSSSLAVETRAATDLKTLIPSLVVPRTDQLRLDLKSVGLIDELVQNDKGEIVKTGTSYQYSEQWEKLGDYEEPNLYPGLYRATLEYGDAEAIGPNKPYYFGQGEGQVEIGERTRCTVQVQIVNAVVRVKTDDLFDSYFTEPKFRLVVDGTPTNYTLSSDQDAPIFVPAGATIAWRGSVRRPSQTSADDREGELYEFDVPARTAVAGTLHTFTFSAEAGGLKGVEVVFEEPLPGGDFDFEMNPDGESDKE